MIDFFINRFSTCINVLRDIQNEKDFEMLREAFRFFRDFPESSIVDALHFYLR